MPELRASFPQHSYLEDIIPVIKYKPSGLRFSKKSNDDQIVSLRTHFERLGLDSDSIKALEILKKADRIDYNVINLPIFT
jgi:hypothetical protein